MKDQITLKDNKWVWPIIDENSWKYQNEYGELASKIIPHVKDKKITISTEVFEDFACSIAIED
jgi:hypothetical protein